jgi:branched-chain amino acid transport system permease protein
MSADITRRTIAAPGFATVLRRHWPWLAAIVVAILLPWLFFDWSTHRHSGFVLTMLSEIGLMAIFALSFNMQMGQAGLLSFGHAILRARGYCAAHMLNAVKAGGLLPVELVSLVGGFEGSPSAHCRLRRHSAACHGLRDDHHGSGELVAACAPMFMGFFGGCGISTDRHRHQRARHLVQFVGILSRRSMGGTAVVLMRCGRPRRRSAG